MEQHHAPVSAVIDLLHIGAKLLQIRQVGVLGKAVKGRTTEADCNDRFHHASVPFVPVQAPAFHRRRILQITPHPGIDYGAFDLTGVDAVLHRMYHSATVPESAAAFAHRCKEAGVPCLFVTPKPAAAYVTAANLPGVWTSTTPESAFAKLLLTNGQDFDTMTLQVNENR